MFLFRWFKRLVFVVLIVAATLYFADYQYKGKTLLEHFHDAQKSGLISEAAQDIKTWFSELFKLGKKAAEDKITTKDKDQLEGVLKNELKDNITKLKAEAEKIAAPKEETKK